MASPRWADHPYARVYSSLAEDHPTVWSDLRLLGGYVRLLVRAEQAYPGLADLPAAVPAEVIDGLVEAEVVDIVSGSLYRFHGLAAERESRQRAGSAGGRARSRSSIRDRWGRFLHADEYPDAGDVLDETSANGQGDAGRALDDTGESGTGESAGHGAGAPAVYRTDEVLARQRPSEPSRATPSHAEPNRAAPSRGSVRDSTPAGARAGGARPRPTPEQIRCNHYTEHHDQHVWIADLGWRCPPCEQARAKGEPTFSEKVEAARSRGPDDSPF